MTRQPSAVTLASISIGNEGVVLDNEDRRSLFGWCRHPLIRERHLKVPGQAFLVVGELRRAAEHCRLSARVIEAWCQSRARAFRRSADRRAPPTQGRACPPSAAS